jgi:MFS family permease
VQIDPSRSRELKLAITLSAVIGFRMLGLFLILPVFMVLASDVPGFSPQLGGLAVGIYGLTQAALQQPFGWLSDRWGRRPVLLLGLALFSAGGIMAAMADTMTGLILGRALQGCGAIAGVAMAFAADFTTPEKRPLTMAIIGMGIGAAFLLSMAASVPLANVLGLDGLLSLTAVFGVVGMLLILTTPRERVVITAPEPAVIRSMKPVWILSLSVFLLHAVMTLLFVVLPGLLVTGRGFALAEHWKLYVPAMVISVLLMLPLLRWMGKNKAEHRVLPWAFAALGLALFFLSREITLAWIATLIVIYFLGFNLLEAAMPSLVARLTGTAGRGRKMGLYSTFQFLGAFAGGAGGGILLAYFGGGEALAIAGGTCLIWSLLFAVMMKRLFLTSELD